MSGGPSGSQLSPKFHDAATYLSSSSSLSQVSSSTKLELYGLYKYLTVSKTPHISRPSIFDMTGRAKWDAWAAAGKKHTANVDAENRYLEIAQSLGWSSTASVGNEQKPPDDVDLEHLSDGEDAPADAGAAGLGLSVSRMARPDVVPDNSLHGLVIACDIPGLVSLLDGQPNLVNELDEHGYAPIHFACDRGHLEVVRLLLSRGANRDIKDPDGFTPLELSKEAEHAEIAELLISHS